ncbi:venom protease-like [Chironomus tepperi]|uniref:venom protease-like n=1 Tax=Chironomus tepperi TaxID=113505 RepID=UPI00391F22BC
MCAKILIFAILTVNCVFSNGTPIKFRNNFEIYLGDECHLRDGSEGICQKPKDCEGSIKELILQKNFSEINLCGFDKNQIVVCCENIPEFIPAPSLLVTPFQRLLCEYSTPVIRLTQNIIGGELAQPMEFPHHVALGYQKTPQSKIEFNCGGSIISDRIVLTAAHCVNYDTPVIVRMGRVSLVENEYDHGPVVDMRVQKNMIKIHPNYKRGIKQNDIAIIKLSKAIKFNEFIQPICLSSPKDMTHKNMTVTGFGIVDMNTLKKSDWLQKITVQGTPFDECRENIRDIKKANYNLDINDTQFCALGINKEDSCRGDSGGPVIYQKNSQYHLYGIVSYSNGCGSIPGVYTKLDAFHEWIESQME